MMQKMRFWASVLCTVFIISTDGYGQSTATPITAAREAAEKSFAKGRQMYLYDLTPNPIVDSKLGTWKMSVHFIRAKDAYKTKT